MIRIIDPFHGGGLLTEHDCRMLLQRHVGDEVAFSSSLLATATRPQVILSQAAALAAGQTPAPVTLQQRRDFLGASIRLLLDERAGESEGFRHRGRERWVINKVRALCAWYSKELECGSQLPAPVNTADSLARLGEIIDEFFAAETAAAEAC
jgi:hypothetical protein